MTLLFYRFCSAINLINWLQNHLLPCPFKTVTGIDCPGCGFQRSIIALFQGQLAQSWSYYPATIPLILLFSYAGYRTKFPIKNDTVFFKTMILLVGNFILLSYAYKMLI